MPSSLLSVASEAACDVSLEAIRADLQSCRSQTLALCQNLSPAQFRTQSHPEFSPVGWHLGHIAYTESLWIAERFGQSPGASPSYERLFAADGLPKAERQNLPSLAEILEYLAVVRSQTKACLLALDTPKEDQLLHWLIQHEGQHAETISMVLAMHQLQAQKMPAMRWQTADYSAQRSETICIEAGEFYQGCGDLAAIDNERPSHRVRLACYEIDRAPVTCAQYREFIRSGGYQTEKWWSPQGWQWQQVAQVEAPLYWTDDLQGVGEASPAENRHYPVCGVSWYEADAYARFVGKRLPTEAEWEKAASQLELIGDVWEWTESWFDRYPGFQAFPYEGYSQIYFDRAHRVLRGGSWASPPSVRRNSFRNWYHPCRREMFAGFRCAV